MDCPLPLTSPSPLRASSLGSSGLEAICSALVGNTTVARVNLARNNATTDHPGCAGAGSSSCTARRLASFSLLLLGGMRMRSMRSLWDFCRLTAALVKLLSFNRTICALNISSNRVGDRSIRQARPPPPLPTASLPSQQQPSDASAPTSLRPAGARGRSRGRPPLPHRARRRWHGPGHPRRFRPRPALYRGLAALPPGGVRPAGPLRGLGERPRDASARPETLVLRVQRVYARSRTGGLAHRAATALVLSHSPVSSLP